MAQAGSTLPEKVTSRLTLHAVTDTPSGRYYHWKRDDGATWKIFVRWDAHR